MRFGRKRGAQPDEAVLDYDAAVILDEEELAEGDIRRAYEEEVLPRLTAYRAEPWQLSEVMDSTTPSYAVAAGGRTYAVHGPGIEENSWGRAQAALPPRDRPWLPKADPPWYGQPS